jgi:ribonuclease HI
MMNLKSGGRFKSAIVDLEEKRFLESMSELPAETRDLFRPPVRRLPYSKARTTCRNISVSLKRGVSLIEGGTANVSGKSAREFWVSLFSHRKSPLVYNKHRWNPVACFHSPESGLCASADLNGEIHVWSAKTGKQKNVFKPINEKFFHVQWMEDESGVYLGTKHFGSDRFVANRYGGITTSFSFADMKFAPAEDQKASWEVMPTTVDPRSGQEYKLAMVGGKDVELIGPNGRSDRIFKLAERSYEISDKRLSRWGNPRCFKFLESDSEGRLPFILGTDEGYLLQFSVEEQQGQSVLKLRREFLAHEAQITSIAISPSKKLMASASLDGTVRIWRMTPSRVLADVDFKTDGTRVIETGDNTPGLQWGDALRVFDDTSFYERIQKIQRGEYQPGQKVTIQVERYSNVDGESIATMETLETELVAAADFAEPVLNLFSAGSSLAKWKKSQQGPVAGDAWIVWTREGFYTASTKGSRHLGWHVNRERDKAASFFQVDQFQRQLYRPALVKLVAENWMPLEEIQSSDEAPAEEDEIAVAIEASPNSAEKFEKVRPPEVLIRSPYGSITSESNQVTVEFDVSTPNHLDVVELNVFVNEQLQRVKPDETNIENDEGIETTTYKVDVELPKKENTITVEAKHAEATSNRAEVVVGCSAIKPLRNGPKLYVLAVGVSKYKDQRFNLRYADVDAEDFVAAWKEQEGKKYEEVIARTITNEQATVDGILDGFDWLKEQDFTSQDVVLVFLAGHAAFDEDDIWVFGSTDMRTDKLVRTGIKNNDVNQLLEKQLHGAGTVILFLDTCHSGGVQRSRGGPSLKGQHSQQMDVWKVSQKRVIASCNTSEVSLEDDRWENGAFTECLLEALADESTAGNDGEINIEELYLHTRELTARLTKNRQTPTTSGRSMNHGITNLAVVGDVKE